MKLETFAEVIAERQQAIELAVDQIAQHAESGDLHDLQVLLVNVTGLLKRDPGIEATADDLYAAATAVVKDRRVNFQPATRKLRLLKDASQRFRQRLMGAAERIGPEELPRLQGLAALYATQRPATSALGGEFHMPSNRAVSHPCVSVVATSQG
jgi:hypothetical protein